MTRMERAHSDLLEAAEALQALFRGEQGEEALVGGLLLAEHLSLVRRYLTGR